MNLDHLCWRPASQTSGAALDVDISSRTTNREIAARLYLSERTAQNHAQYILTKLDLSNRGQIPV